MSFFPSYQGPERPYALSLSALVVVLILLFGVRFIGEARRVFHLGRVDSFSISVDGRGEVTVIPDIAVLSFGHSAEGKSVRQAQDQVVSKLQQLRTDLGTVFGIDEKDIRTASYSVQPQYAYDEGRAPRITGYQVRQVMEVKVRKTDQVSALLERASELGLGEVFGPNFQTDDPKVSIREARAKAFEDARVNAEAIAKELGVTLGPVVGYYETSANPMMYEKAYAENIGMGFGGGGPVPSVDPGSNDIEVTVNVTYLIP